MLDLLNEPEDPTSTQPAEDETWLSLKDALAPASLNAAEIVKEEYHEDEIEVGVDTCYTETSEGTHDLYAVTTLQDSNETQMLQMHDLCSTTLKGMFLFDKVSGSINAGTCTLLLGPRGCGKSSLMRALNGTLKTAICGKIARDGLKLSKNQLQKMSILVENDSEVTFMESLTVREALETVRSLNACDSHEENAMRIQKLIDSFQILRFSDTKLPDLSKSQRTVFQIASATLQHADLLLLDEIFSDLTPSNAMHLKQDLQNRASTGTAVLCSASYVPTSLFNSFSHVILMDSYGNMIYNGESGRRVVEHFTHMGYSYDGYLNIVDYLTDICNTNEWPVRGYVLDTRKDSQRNDEVRPTSTPDSGFTMDLSAARSESKLLPLKSTHIIPPLWKRTQLICKMIAVSLLVFH